MNRTPLKKKGGRLRSNSLSPRRQAELAADELWKLAIKERDNFTCQMCGREGQPRKEDGKKTKGLHSHHIVTRSVKHIRHALHNGICLCSSCHKLGINSAHKRPESFRTWLIEKWFKSEEAYQALILESNIPRKPDYQMAILELKAYLEEI